jgi:hypothetical protein
MRGIKHTIKKHEIIKDRQKGVYSKEILDYTDAKNNIYILTYKWVLINYMKR